MHEMNAQNGVQHWRPEPFAQHSWGSWLGAAGAASFMISPRPWQVESKCLLSKHPCRRAAWPEKKKWIEIDLSNIFKYQIK